MGAAILQHGRILAARRTTPPAAAGRWELPGGKVERGESREDALVREIVEELGCAVRVDHWLPLHTGIGGTHRLFVAVVALVDSEPVPREHDVIRWVDADQLESLDWLEPDLPFLAAVKALLEA